ncbi:MAG TPA: Fe-S cluster assembly protein SufD, partial [Isosphaeraceae bacterium]|nr:Fe-S cluster assembly protein SufD [Isosphaeraceae bacterium]
MNSAPTAIRPPATGGFTEEAFKAFLKDRDEPAWLTDRRKEAFAIYQATAWPTARDEEWRRT